MVGWILLVKTVSMQDAPVLSNATLENSLTTPHSPETGDDVTNHSSIVEALIHFQSLLLAKTEQRKEQQLPACQLWMNFTLWHTKPLSCLWMFGLPVFSSLLQLLRVDELRSTVSIAAASLMPQIRTFLSSYLLDTTNVYSVMYG